MAKLRAVLAKVSRKPGQQSLFQRSYEEDLLAAINPDNQEERYGRVWRFSRPRQRQRFLVGRLGFIGKEPGTETFYDEQRKDFVDQPLVLGKGYYSHWVADLDSHLMVFELKPPKIEVQSFIGAFDGLLSSPTELAFTLELLQEPRKFYEWAGTVQRVTSFKAVMRAPNPGWGNRADDIYADLIRGTNADRVVVELKKEPDSEEGLVVREGPVAGMVGFGETGNSLVHAQGVRDGETRQYDSRRAGLQGTAVVDQHASQDSIWDVLLNLYHKLRPRQ